MAAALDADFLAEDPKISTACKTFMSYRLAALRTDGRTSGADADRATRLHLLAARSCMKAVNEARPAAGPAALALEQLKETSPGALPSKAFGRAYLRDAGVASALRATPGAPGLDGLDVEFIQHFLASAFDEGDDLTWASDYKQALASRNVARVEQAKMRLASPRPDMDPALAAEARRVHDAVVGASSFADEAKETASRARGGQLAPLNEDVPLEKRPLPSLPKLRSPRLSPKKP
mmetsp:Transcript_9098/g.27255  ORF Transcript_9098/g.27255 Transcript_9098/m.27255 type:complete len:235 (+) Transcript_9098:357-1061(+)